MLRQNKAHTPPQCQHNTVHMYCTVHHCAVHTFESLAMICMGCPSLKLHRSTPKKLLSCSLYVEMLHQCCQMCHVYT